MSWMANETTPPSRCGFIIPYSVQKLSSIQLCSWCCQTEADGYTSNSSFQERGSYDAALCAACQSPPNLTMVQELKKGASRITSWHRLGPLAVIWISGAAHEGDFHWELIRNRLKKCYSYAPNLVSGFPLI